MENYESIKEINAVENHESYEVVKNECMCQVIEKHGYSAKLEREYTMCFLRVYPEGYAPVDVRLDTYKDLGGHFLAHIPPDKN